MLDVLGCALNSDGIWSEGLGAVMLLVLSKRNSL